jgi:hypothetical protein
LFSKRPQEIFSPTHILNRLPETMVEKAFRKGCFSQITATRNSSIKTKKEVLEVQLYRARESTIAIVKQLQLFVVVGGS